MTGSESGVNLPPEKAADEGEYGHASYDTDRYVGDGPRPLAVRDQPLGVRTEGAERAESTAKTDGQPRVEGRLVGPFFLAANHGPGEQCRGGKIGSEGAQGKDALSIQPDAKKMACDGAQSTAEKDGKKEERSKGIHGVEKRVLRRSERVKVAAAHPPPKSAPHMMSAG